MNDVVARKICLLGDFAVGKTSLVSRFVHQTFAERYLTTVGVKVDTRLTPLPGGAAIKLVIWDLAGVARLNPAGRAYIHGASGYLYVCDGTRLDTLEAALALRAEVRTLVGDQPSLLLVNKSDLIERQEVSDAAMAAAAGQFLQVWRTSARSGERVEASFARLAAEIGP